MAAPSETVASGSTAAQLYEQYGNQIYRYCLGRLRDREEAADALQNTFLRVHVALEKGVLPRYEASWLYKIAHNVCLSWIDSAGRRALVETPRDLDSLDDALLAAPASEHEAVEDLAEALAALPHNLRQAILLREWQGLSYAEIAEAMDTTVPAVETLLVRARRQMTATLRRAAAAVFDVLGLRGLLSGGLGKLSAGAALLALGGSGIGATVVLADRPSSPHPRPATSIARPAIAAVPTRAPATAPRARAATVSVAAHPVSTPTQSRPSVSSATSAAEQSPSAPASAPATASTVVSSAPAPDVATPSLPFTPTVSTPTLASVPPPSQVVTTATPPPLPVTTPSLPVPTVTIP